MASIEYVVNATDAASGVFAKIAMSADGLDKQLEDLSKRVATPGVELEDAKFQLGMVNAAKRLDSLSAKIADPKVEVDGSKAQLEILRINAMLDRLDAKRVSVSVDVDRSLLSRLGGAGGGILSGLGGLLGAGAQAGGGAIQATGQYGQAAAISAAAIAAALLGPALLPLGLGGLVGGGAALGGLKVGSTAFGNLQSLQKQLRNVTGTTAASEASRDRIQRQIAALRSSQGTQLALGAAGHDVTKDLQSTFLGALTSTGKGFSFAGPNQSFLASLTGILRQIAGFVKSIGPQLGDLFRASVPYLQLFVKFLERAAKDLLPAFTNMLREMTPYLPLIFQGLNAIIKGFVGFLNAIGPSGMQASAKIFVVAAKGMADVLVAFGHTINWLTEHVPTWAHNIAAWWDRLRHETDVIFTAMRHDIAAWWDRIFENSVGMVIRLAHNVETQFNSLRHGIATLYDTIRHDIASAWDAIWNNTIGRIERGVHDANDWFHRLPGMALASLRGFGSSLYSFARAALGDFLSGLRSVGGSVLGWLRNFIGGIPHAIMSFLHMSPPHAGSVFYDLGANLMHHFEAGVKSRLGSIGSAISGAIGGGIGATAGGVQNTAFQIAKSIGWGNQWGAINAIAMSESGWSMTARNPSSGAYGIAQFINGPSEYYQYGGNPNTAVGQITAFYNYIRQRYGTPANAWAFHLAHGWYDQGGWLPPGLSLALNTTGKPERVGGTPGNTYNITVNVPPSVNKADIGRQVVETIREYERRSGPGWRK